MGERPAYYLQAATLFSLAAEQKCEIVVSSLSMVTSNFICCERGHIAQDTWKQKAKAMKEFMEICPVDSKDILAACNSRWKDFEDCVQFQAAKRSGCDVLVTRNTPDFSESDLQVLNPDEAIDLIGNCKPEEPANI